MCVQAKNSKRDQEKNSLRNKHNFHHFSGNHAVVARCLLAPFKPLKGAYILGLLTCS